MVIDSPIKEYNNCIHRQVHRISNGSKMMIMNHMHYYSRISTLMLLWRRFQYLYRDCLEWVKVACTFPIFRSVLVLLGTRCLRRGAYGFVYKDDKSHHWYLNCHLLILQGQQVVIIQMKSFIIMIQIGTVLDIYCSRGSQIFRGPFWMNWVFQEVLMPLPWKNHV